MPLYQIDPAHTGAAFKVRHMMISHVKGEFTKISGTVNFDEAKPFESQVDVSIDAASIHTREEKRDEHLRSADFFDVAKFPTITFVVDGLTPEVKDPWGGLRRGASASLTINRKDFGLIWNAALDAGGWMIGDEVNITVDVELVRQA
jgi:polyisoprenoid-binding protein YceI